MLVVIVGTEKTCYIPCIFTSNIAHYEPACRLHTWVEQCFYQVDFILTYIEKEGEKKGRKQANKKESRKERKEVSK